MECDTSDEADGPYCHQEWVGMKQTRPAPGLLAEMAEIAPADVQEHPGDPGRVARSVAPGVRHDHRHRAFAYLCLAHSLEEHHASRPDHLDESLG